MPQLVPIIYDISINEYTGELLDYLPFGLTIFIITILGLTTLLMNPLKPLISKPTFTHKPSFKEIIEKHRDRTIIDMRYITTTGYSIRPRKFIYDIHDITAHNLSQLFPRARINRRYIRGR